MPDTNKPVVARSAPPMGQVRRMLDRYRAATEVPRARATRRRTAGPPVLKDRPTRL